MNKNEFMRKLKDGLVGLNQTDKREILLDYEEHFLDGLKLGRTEEEICESLGDPTTLAKRLKSESRSTGVAANDGINTAAYIIGIIALSVGCLWLFGFMINVVATIFGSTVGIFAILVMPFATAVKVCAVSALVMVIAITVMIALGLVMLTILVCRWYKQMINGLTKDEDKKIKREFKMFKVKGGVWAMLVIIAVLAFGGVLYGALTVGADVAAAAINGDFNNFISHIDDLEDINNDADLVKFIEDNEDFPLGLIVDENKFKNSDFRFIRGFGFKKTVDQTEMLDLSGVEEIQISASFSGIEVMSGSEASAKLSGYSRHGTEEIKVTKSGDTLRIDVVPAVGLFNNAWINLDVILPDDVMEKVSVTNSSGSIEVVGIKAKTLDVQCSSGSIRVDGEGYAYDLLKADGSSGRISIANVIEANRIELNNKSGSIIMENIISDDIRVTNKSGRIEGQMIEGNFDIHNTSGNISIYADLGDGQSKVNCTSGRIELSLAEEPMNITASATSGYVNVEQMSDLTVMLDKNDSFAAVYSDESVGTPSIDASSTSGNVKIMFH